MAKAAVYFINGVVRINGTDVATISEVDSSVTLTIAEEQKQFKGSHIAAIETHTISVEGKIKISKPVLNKAQLEKLLGMNQITGFLDDGTTPSTNSKISLNDYFQRPEVALLITGKDDKTGKLIEIAAAKAVLLSDFEVLLSKEEFAMPEMEFLVLGDADNLDNALFEVRFEN